MDELDEILGDIDALLERRSAAIERDLLRVLASRRRQMGRSPRTGATVVPIDRKEP